MLHLPFELKIQSVDVANQSFSAAGLKRPAQGGLEVRFENSAGDAAFADHQVDDVLLKCRKTISGRRQIKNAVERLLHLDPLAREMWVSTLLICGWARKAAKIRKASSAVESSRPPSDLGYSITRQQVFCSMSQPKRNGHGLTS